LALAVVEELGVNDFSQSQLSSLKENKSGLPWTIRIVLVLDKEVLTGHYTILVKI
jgi:hypothetical protein